MTSQVTPFQKELFALYKKYGAKGFAVAMTEPDEEGYFESGIVYVNKKKEMFADHELSEMSRIIGDDVVPRFYRNSRVNDAVFQAHQILSDTE